MNTYDQDPRVKREGDGYRLPDPIGGDWHIASTGTGGWIAYSADRAVMDEGDRYHTRRTIFDTADDAIAHLIGPPR